MLLRLVSDIHTEFGNCMDNVLLPMDEDKDTVLVLGGDIGVGVDACNFVKQISPRFRHVLYVLGNHEYYQNDLAYLPNSIKQELKDFPNITLLNNETTYIEDCRFVGSTLWTDMNKENPTIMRKVEEGMYDYIAISNKGHKIKASATTKEHKKSISFLHKELTKNFSGKTVVITHHLPSYESIDPIFRNAHSAILNNGFYSNLNNIIEKYSIDLWMHGHTHCSASYELFGTKVRANPLGYYPVEDPENKKFDPKFRIEV